MLKIFKLSWLHLSSRDMPLILDIFILCSQSGAAQCKSLGPHRQDIQKALYIFFFNSTFLNPQLNFFHKKTSKIQGQVIIFRGNNGDLGLRLRREKRYAFIRFAPPSCRSNTEFGDLQHVASHRACFVRMSACSHEKVGSSRAGTTQTRLFAGRVSQKAANIENLDLRRVKSPIASQRCPQGSIARRNDD